MHRRLPEIGLLNLFHRRARGDKRMPPAASSESGADTERVRSFRTLDSLHPPLASGLAGLQGPEPTPPGSRPRLGDVFTPTQPKALGPFFIGREAYLRRLAVAVEEERAHVVLFGDRGRGKTSLANAFSRMATEAGYLVLRRACSAASSFEELFRSFLADIPPRMLPQGAALPEGRFGAMQASDVLRQLRHGHVVLLIDEFDRVRSEELRANLAETIKNLSDAGARVTFLVVGVARSLDDLLGHHPSIQRNVLGLHLAPMEDAEIRRMMEKGTEAV
ncbi:MAG TPA: ATP-binding protein, partial [Acetobacteraceae bacterium]